MKWVSTFTLQNELKSAKQSVCVIYNVEYKVSYIVSCFLHAYIPIFA